MRTYTGNYNCRDESCEVSTYLIPREELGELVGSLIREFTGMRDTMGLPCTFSRSTGCQAEMGACWHVNESLRTLGLYRCPVAKRDSPRLSTHLLSCAELPSGGIDYRQKDGHRSTVDLQAINSQAVHWWQPHRSRDPLIPE